MPLCLCLFLILYFLIYSNEYIFGFKQENSVISFPFNSHLKIPNFFTYF